jgi:Enoyl-CoA hydratase/isomerase
VTYPDHLEADRFSALGDHPVRIVDVQTHQPSAAPVQALIIGVDRDGSLPDIDPACFDLLLTTKPGAGSPWVTIPRPRLASVLATIEAAAVEFPKAATILGQTLRLTEILPTGDALIAESLAYSTLLGGHEFRQWLTRRPASEAAAPPDMDGMVTIDRADDHVTLTLASPDTRNAMTAPMRDALYAALANILDDPSRPTAGLRAAGKCFSTGGDLAEFGTATDLAEAHVARTLHSCARVIAALGDRTDVHVQGACIGSGLEIAAAADRRIATADAWFQLPELRMGLIPGAGGTVSVARAIGRHRTCWLALTGARLRARQALDWGLIHAIEPVE